MAFFQVYYDGNTLAQRLLLVCPELSVHGPEANAEVDEYVCSNDTYGNWDSNYSMIDQ